MRTKNLSRRVWTLLSMFVLSVALSGSMALAAVMATVQGQVVDQNGEPIIGASVLVKGTTNGTITDFDGNFTITNVDNGATLVVSYVGYITQEVKATRGKMKIVLKEDSKVLDDVVVVGYSTQAKKDITGSVAVVSRDALTEVPVATFAEALQGKASGVYINNSGGPAGETTIRIRGVGSVNGSDPLIIVDGVQGVDINSVNPNDIESMQVLKDAAATAIYGAQAANGVIIVTTKQGSKESKVKVSYSGYVSASKMANSGYNMLGAWDYMKAVQTSQENQVKYRGYTLDQVGSTQFGSIKDGDLQMPYTIVPAGLSVSEAAARFGVTSYDASTTAGRQPILEAMQKAYGTSGTDSYALSSYYYIKDVLGGSEEEAKAGTNWFDEVTQTGISQNHEISLQGGGEKGMYSTSFGYTNREGTLKNSSFERYNIRINATYNPTKHFTIGINSNQALMMIKGERGRQSDQSVFGQTYTMGAMVPAYNVGGQFAGSQGGLGRDTSALCSVLNTADDWSRMYRSQNALFAEIKDPWIKGLSLRTQFSATLMGNWSATMTERSIEWNKEGSSVNSFSETGSWNFNWQWTNTATYKTHFGEHHDLTVLAGMEALKNNLGRSITGGRQNYVFEKDPNTWTLNNGDAATVSNSGYMQSKTTMFGYFGRIDYSYDGKYLVTATIRRDASSKFAAKNRWGTFPSVSLGWRVSDEPFMKKAHESWLDDLKLRAGYGTTGNSNIGAYNYAFQYASATRYNYALEGQNSGSDTGFAVSTLGDANAKWETVKMFNVGVDLTAFNNRLTSSLDFYIKNTSDMLVSASWTYLAGSGTKPNVNIGNIKNTGIDFQIGWRDKIGKLGYNISANASWYKNEVTKLGASSLYTSTRLSQCTITEVGQPISMFYGYVLDGIYKSEEEVLNYGALPYGVGSKESLVENASSWVGHYKFKDVNGDGQIDSSDRTIIGNPHPDLTGGVNVSLTYQNWDLGTYLFYSIGNDLFKHYEYYTLYGNLSQNYSYDRINKAWSNDNPNGTLPLWVYGDTSIETTVSHSGYIQDGSYLRMQTLTLGYTLPKSITKKLTMSKIRVYAQLANVFTITGYDGLDPEVRSDMGDGTGNANDMMKGIDYGSYGMPRQYLLGINVEF